MNINHPSKVKTAFRFLLYFPLITALITIYWVIYVGWDDARASAFVEMWCNFTDDNYDDPTGTLPVPSDFINVCSV